MNESKTEDVNKEDLDRAGRAPPITEYEKSLLLSLVSNHKSVIESKQTNAHWTSKKNSTWESISKEFSSQAGVSRRSANQLKKAWENLKTKAKTEISNAKKAVKKTGGGEKEKDISNNTLMVTAIVPLQMVPLDNPFDSDGPPTSIQSGSTFEENEHNLQNVQISEGSSSAAVGTTATSTNAGMICPPTDPDKIRIPRRKTSEMPELKRKLPAAQEILIQFEEQAQDKKLELLDLQIQIERRRLVMMEEEHAIKIRILSQKLLE